MTVRYRQQEFPDEYLRPNNTSRRVIGNYYGDECEVAIVSGMTEGIGKSGSCNHVLAAIYGYVFCLRSLSLLRSCISSERNSSRLLSGRQIGRLQRSSFATYPKT